MVAAAAVAAVLVIRPGSSDSSSTGTQGEAGGIDYNCNLPGTGCPWLVHLPPQEWESDDPETGVTILDGTHLQGFFRATTPPGDYIPYTMWLPVAVGPDGPAWPDVYRTLCAVHPDLGGSGLRQLSVAELEGMFVFDLEGEADDEGGDRLLTDDVTRSADEAHMGGERIRFYWLPELEPYVREYITSLSCPSASGTTTTTTGEETQRWRVTLTGYEIDDLNAATRTPRTAVRFDYNLAGEFTLVRRNGAWKVEGDGTITSPTITASAEYQPAESWEVRPLECQDCTDYATEGQLWVNLTDDGVRFTWGINPIRVWVRSKRLGECQPAPSCSDWLDRYHNSATFWGRVNDHRLPLQDDFEEGWSYTSSFGDRWVAYRYTLNRLDG